MEEGGGDSAAILTLYELEPQIKFINLNTPFSRKKRNGKRWAGNAGGGSAMILTLYELKPQYTVLQTMPIFPPIKVT